MAKMIAVMSGKGGVGKSSIAAMVAKIVSEKHRTAVLDYDICGPSIVTALGVEGALVKTDAGFAPLRASENLDVLSFGSVLKPTDAVIWRGPKKQIFLDLFFNSVRDYDYVVIDTPPGISEEHGFLVGKDVRAIIVTTPQNVALNDAQRCIEFCQESKIEILGVVENMACLQCECCSAVHHPFGGRGGSLLAEEYGLHFMGRLMIEPRWSASLDDGTFNEKYRSLASYGALTEMLAALEIV